MPGLILMEDADHLARRGIAGAEEFAEGFGAQVGLIAERDDEVGKRGIFDCTDRGGNDRTHHAALGSLGRSAFFRRNGQTVKLKGNG